MRAIGALIARMNYRHIYHAGNFADVMKHLALVLCLDHMKKKDKPFCVIDAHAGIGLYDLRSGEAEKTQEWHAGIGRFTGEIHADNDFRLFLNLVADDLDRQIYPGSPVLSGKMLREGDRLIANELHPDDVRTLEKNMRPFPQARISNLDAYECIRANIPPQEKRGFIIIDPPFEEKDEFQILCRQMKEWKKRFATGVFLLWYPIKAHLAVEAMKDAARELALPRTWCMETLLHPRDMAGSFNGCGVILFNAPFTVPERLEALGPFLQQHMGLNAVECGWLTQP